MHNSCHKLSLERSRLPEDNSNVAILQKKIEEGTGIIEKLSKLKYEMARDKPLE